MPVDPEMRVPLEVGNGTDGTGELGAMLDKTELPTEPVTGEEFEMVLEVLVTPVANVFPALVDDDSIFEVHVEPEQPDELVGRLVVLALDVAFAAGNGVAKPLEVRAGIGPDSVSVVN